MKSLTTARMNLKEDSENFKKVCHDKALTRMQLKEISKDKGQRRRNRQQRQQSKSHCEGFHR
jgi:hypothetical protein